MFQTSYKKTLCVPKDVRTTLERYLKDHPDVTLHAAMLRSLRLGLPLLLQESATSVEP